VKEYGGIDSKFRYVVVASLRAKELLRGSKPKIKSKSKNLIRVAQEEVKSGIIDYKIIELGQDIGPEKEDGIFIGEKLVQEIAREEFEMATEIKADKEKPKKAKKKS
jgi:DNA-directed RNA polymerase subunit K/omega